MSRAIRLIAGLALVLAACGGGDGDAESTSPPTAADDVSTSTAAPTTTAEPTTTAVPVAANPSDDFCGFAEEYAETVGISPIGMNPDDLEDVLRSTADAINRAVQVAPGEIKDDVELYADAYGGFIELLDELGFNFLAFDDDVLDDPRMLALDDPALEEAGDRISTYCGLDDFIAAGPGTVGGSGGGTGGGLPEVTLPDGFPSELVPPGGEVNASISVSGALSVGIEVASPIDEVIDYYTELIGAPTVQINEPKGALWTTEFEGSTVNIVLSEISPGRVNVNIIIE